LSAEVVNKLWVSYSNEWSSASRASHKGTGLISALLSVNSRIFRSHGRLGSFQSRRKKLTGVNALGIYALILIPFDAWLFADCFIVRTSNSEVRPTIGWLIKKL
jgi:hypothetical protein